MSWIDKLFKKGKNDLQAKAGDVVNATAGHSGTFSFSEYGKNFFFVTGVKDRDVAKKAVNLEKEAFSASPYVYIVINAIAQAISHLHYAIVPTDPSKPVAYNKQYWEAYYLLKQPNNYEKWNEFIYRIAVNYLVSGNAFIFGRRPNAESMAANYTEMLVPNTSTIQVQVDINGYAKTIHGRFLSENFKEVAANVLHLKKANLWNTNEVFGQSPLTALGNVWQTTSAIIENEMLIHRNHGVNGMLTPINNETPLTPTERAKINEEINRQLTGSDNKGKYNYSPVELKFIQLGALPKDLASNESLLNQFRMVCAAYQVPSMVLGDKAASTYNNMMEAKLAYYNEAVLPVARKITEDLSQWYIQDVMKLEGYHIKIEETKIQAFIEAQNAYSLRLMREIQAGILTVEEARSILYPNNQSEVKYL